MDSISQAVLGAALGSAVAGKTLGRSAILGGALLGTLPDMDVVIDYGSAVANFSQHRGFSHSLLILFPLAVVLAWVFHRWRPLLSYQRWLAFTSLILITHPLLDAFTTYGTQLFWPFAKPVAISSIFIIDPLYTLPLLFAVIWTLWRPSQTKAAYTGLAVSTLYLGWTLLAQQAINQKVESTLAAEGLEDAPRLVQPMPLTTFLWRVTVMAEDERLEIVTGFFDGDIPLSIERFPQHPELEAATLALPEGRRLVWFTRGFLAYSTTSDRKLAVTDIRLGVPGAHPFTFILAEAVETGSDTWQWQSVTSYQSPRPTIRAGLLTALWDRLSGKAPILCLATLETRQLGDPCG
ncbi:MAG: metal-dependent hydrolase [Marinobacter sp.]|uniref:metal-dependent hydrolase n=1 Tax=Marinobacter sp. TaxID=50741 RepID=UPI00349FD52D